MAKQVVSSRTGRSVQNVKKGTKPAVKTQPASTPRTAASANSVGGGGGQSTIASRPTKVQGVLTEGVKNTKSYVKAEIASRASASPATQAVRPPTKLARGAEETKLRQGDAKALRNQRRPGGPFSREARMAGGIESARELRNYRKEIVNRAGAKANLSSTARPSPLSTAGVSRVGGSPSVGRVAVRSAASGASRGAMRGGAVGAAVGAVVGLLGAAVKSGSNPNAKGRSGTAQNPVGYRAPMAQPKITGVSGSVSAAPTVKPSGISPTRKAFNMAFASARKEGARGFSFRGKQYNTKVK